MTTKKELVSSLLSDLATRIMPESIIYRLVGKKEGFYGYASNELKIFPGPWANIFRNIRRANVQAIDYICEDKPFIRDPLYDGLPTDKLPSDMFLLYGFKDYTDITELIDDETLSMAFKMGMTVEMISVKEAVIGRSGLQVCFKASDVIEIEDVTSDIRNMLLI